MADIIFFIAQTIGFYVMGYKVGEGIGWLVERYIRG